MPRFLRRSNTNHATDQAADRAADQATDTGMPDFVVDDTYYEDTYDAAEDEANSLAADAADTGANADLAAAYGSNHTGYIEARMDQAAARELLPTLTPAAARRVAQLQAHKGRPVTAAEVRWLQHYSASHDADEPTDPTTDEESPDDYCYSDDYDGTRDARYDRLLADADAELGTSDTEASADEL